MIALFGGNKDIDIKWWNFPAGERGVKILNPIDIQAYKSFTLTLTYGSDTDFMDMLLLVNAIRNIAKNTSIRLKIPYFPYARQDRLMVDGESFSLQVAVQLIKLCDFTEVEVWDPHSDVLAGMFDPGHLQVISQWKLLARLIQCNTDCTDRSMAALVAPDAGALKKIYKLADYTRLPVIEASKVRDCTNGNIISSNIDMIQACKYDHLIICDDICGFGGTFIQLAEFLRTNGYVGRIDLVTTHGIYDKNALDNLQKVFNNVLCVNNLKEK